MRAEQKKFSGPTASRLSTLRRPGFNGEGGVEGELHVLVRTLGPCQRRSARQVAAGESLCQRASVKAKGGVSVTFRRSGVGITVDHLGTSLIWPDVSLPSLPRRAFREQVGVLGVRRGRCRVCFRRRVGDDCSTPAAAALFVMRLPAREIESGDSVTPAAADQPGQPRFLALGV